MHKLKNRTAVCQNPVCRKEEHEMQGEKLLICSTCRGVKYCSRSCQQQDWKFHRVICEKPRLDTYAQKKAKLPLSPEQTMQVALMSFKQAIWPELELALTIPYFPAHRANKMLYVHLRCIWQPEIADERSSFMLESAADTTKDAILEEFDYSGNMAKVFKTLEERDDAARQELAKAKKKIHPTPIILVISARCLSANQHLDPEYRSVTSTLQGLVSVSPSSLDPRNLNLSWESALRRSLLLPPLPPRTDIRFTESAISRILNIYKNDPDWLERAKKFNGESVAQCATMFGAKGLDLKKLRAGLFERDEFEDLRIFCYMEANDLDIPS